MDLGEVNDVLIEAGVGPCSHLPRNLGSPGTHVYLLRDVVVKVVADPCSARMQREHDALVHLESTSLPVPRMLKAGTASDGRSWVVMSRLRGVPPKDAIRPGHELSEPLAGQLGEMAARLHKAPAPPGFGTWARDPGISLVDEHRQRVASVMKRARQAQLVPSGELEVLSDLLCRTGEALDSAPDVPVLAHRDLQPRNVLVDSRGRLTGLVDFEAAGGGDPAEDFSRIALDWKSPGFSAFCTGYQRAGGDLGDDAPERVTFHVLYWAALIFGHVALHFPGYLEPARLAVQRASAGESPWRG